MLLRGHGGHRHFWQRALSRRQFLGTTIAATGAAATASLWLPGLAEASASAAPKPIPGGITIGGVTFHVFLPGTGDQSTITDFNGAIAATDTSGMGTGIDAEGNSATQVFDADMRFVQGEYMGLDGANHNGTFGFI
jgi:hypothetical protein